MNSFYNALTCNFSTVTTTVQKKIAPQLTLHQEVIIMLSGALTIYLVADLRDLARKGNATVGLEELEAPIPMQKMMLLLRDNKQALKDSGSYDDIEEQLNALENLKLHNSNGILGNLMGSSTKMRVAEFVDVNSSQELVHAITVNDTEKRITVVFRGSVTTKDFITDAKVGQIKGTPFEYNVLNKLYSIMLR
jgi:hypothetical protein